MFNKFLKEKYRPVPQSGKGGSLSLFPKPSYPLQYSGLENSMDCVLHEVTKSQTRLSDFHFDHHQVVL